MFLSSRSFVLRAAFPFLEAVELSYVLCFLGWMGKLGPCLPPQIYLSASSYLNRDESSLPGLPGGSLTWDPREEGCEVGQS